MPNPIAALESVSRHFHEGGREHRVLDKVDLEIAAGERLALLGASGSGKSTLLNLLGGIDRPDQGRVLVEATDLAGLSEHRRTLFRRRRIGFVYQFFNLIPTLTVRENVALPLELLGQALDPADALLEQVGLADRGDAFPDVLSGGEQQRVALARALAHRPALVLADEPTGNLDARHGRAVLDLLAALTREQGTTLVIVTHSRAVSGYCERVLSLEDGRLTQGGGAEW